MGKADGKGIYKHASGNKYIGNYKEGKMHGLGTFFHSNGNRLFKEILRLINFKETFLYILT